jgi:hypothetical protein
MDNKFKNNQKNVNIIIDLERLKGEKISNISQYNNAMQRQVIQNQQKLQILKHQNENPSQLTRSNIKEVKNADCGCD